MLSTKWSLSNGGSRFAGWPDALRRRQRHRHGDGRRGADRGEGNASPGRSLWNRSLSSNPAFLKEIKEIGFAGVQNFPTVGLYDGLFRKNLEETGMGYGLEVEMVRIAHAMDLLTTPYCFNPAEATAMAGAGADIIVAHLGLTTKGSIGASTAVTLEDAPARSRKLPMRQNRPGTMSLFCVMAARFRNRRMPNTSSIDTKGVHGFYGASSMERLPVEKAVTETMQSYKAIKLEK